MKVPGLSTFGMFFQTTVILGTMAVLFGILGWVTFGIAGVLGSVILDAFLLAGSVNSSGNILLRMYGARPLDARKGREVYALVYQLSVRAGLDRAPRLYHIRSRSPNAFSVGTRDESAIALTTGLLVSLDMRELAGVLAHEIAHIRNNDVRLHAAAGTIARITSVLSLMGQFMLVVYLPAALLAGAEFPFMTIILLISAPALSSLLQLALSRTREFDADLTAAFITGDPLGLASALKKIDDRQPGDLFFKNTRRVPLALRTHPYADQRVARLEALAEDTWNEPPSRDGTPP